MKHILAVHEASNVAASQELEEDEEFDLPASGESAVQVCPATSLFFQASHNGDFIASHINGSRFVIILYESIRATGLYVGVKICLYFSDKLTLNTKKRVLATIHKKDKLDIASLFFL